MRDESWLKHNFDLHADRTAMRAIANKRFNDGLALGIVAGIFATLVGVAVGNYFGFLMGACG